MDADRDEGAGPVGPVGAGTPGVVTERRTRVVAAEVVGVCCPACGGRGRAHVSDDRTVPVEVACRRCGGRGIVAPPPGSRAAIVLRAAGDGPPAAGPGVPR